MAEAGTPTYPVKTIAKLLMLTDRRVQQLAKEGIIPKGERGRYELAPVVQAYIRYLQDRVAGDPGEGTHDWGAARAKHMSAKADLAELELMKARSEVIDATEVKRAWQILLGEVRAGLIGATPARISQALRGVSDDKAVKRIVKDELAAAMKAISEKDIEAALDEAEPADGIQ